MSNELGVIATAIAETGADKIEVSDSMGFSSTIINFAPLFLIGAVFYFFLIRPQQKRVKEHKNIVSNLSRGDEVVVANSIIAKVTGVSDKDIITAEIAQGVEVKIRRDSIAEVLNHSRKSTTEKKKGNGDSAVTTLATAKTHTTSERRSKKKRIV